MSFGKFSPQVPEPAGRGLWQPGTLVLISFVKTVYEKNKSIPPGRAFCLILLALSGKSGLVTAYLLRCLNFVTTF